MTDTVGAEFIVNTTTTGGQGGASVAALSNGGFVVTWTDESQTGGDTDGYAVRGQRYNASGTKVGAEFLVNTATTGLQYDPSVAALRNGGFVVTWRDTSGTGRVRGQRYNASGTKVGAEFLVNTTTEVQRDPSVAALSNGGFVVTWTDLSQTGGDTDWYAVRGQRYNASGTKVGAEFLVNTTTTGSQGDPSVAALSNGGFVVTWTDESETGGDTDNWAVRGQRYNASGTKVGAEFLVNTTTEGEQYEGSVAALRNGGFVVTWTDESETGGDTSHYAVRGQRYNASGTKVGNEFLVNTTTEGDQWYPSVAALSNGGFVITWSDSSQTGGDTDNWAVRGQRYNASGVRVGDEFLVNTTTEGVQYGTSVAALRNGGFVATWRDESRTGGDTDGGAVRGQIFRPTVAAAATRMASTLSSTPVTLTASSGLPSSGASSTPRTNPTLLAAATA